MMVHDLVGQASERPTAGVKQVNVRWRASNLAEVKLSGVIALYPGSIRLLLETTFALAAVDPQMPAIGLLLRRRVVIVRRRIGAIAACGRIVALLPHRLLRIVARRTIVAQAKLSPGRSDHAQKQRS